MDAQDQIEIGVVGRPHGVRGGFYVERSIDGEALTPGFRVSLGDREFTVRSRAGTLQRPILQLEGLDDRDAAKALRGRPLLAPRGELTPLADGEFYAADLEGLVVRTRAGTELGRVRAVANLPSVDVLEVEAGDGDGEPLQVPMVRDAIVAIEPGDGVTVDEEFLGIG